MDDEPTIYAADSAEEATMLYGKLGDLPLEPGYPRELTDDELDAEQPDYDENEEPTGVGTTIRHWLEEATEPGYLCGAMR